MTAPPARRPWQAKTRPSSGKIRRTVPRVAGSAAALVACTTKRQPQQRLQLVIPCQQYRPGSGQDERAAATAASASWIRSRTARILALSSR